MPTTSLAKQDGGVAPAVLESPQPDWIPVPKDPGHALQIAETLSKSTLIPESFRGKPGDVLIALQMGAEVGLRPMQALQGIAVINGRPSIWGDTALALVRAHPSIASVQEVINGAGDDRVAVCTVTRVRGARTEQTVRKFSVRDAMVAGLWTKQGPWKLYPERMLQMRARGFAIRDAAADILKGLAIGEEQVDIPTHEPVSVTPVGDTKSDRVASMLAATASAPAVPEPASDAVDTAPDEEGEQQPNVALPDLSTMTDIEIGELVRDEAKARGIEPPTLREIVKTIGGGRLVRSTASSILAKIYESPVLDA